jgi:uncharacterized protein YxjI
MDSLSDTAALVVRQQKEWGEIATGFETRNRYVVSDLEGRTLFQAAEEEGSILARWFLKALRPFTIRILDSDGRTVLALKRPFRFYFHRLEIRDGDGARLGGIRRRFAVVRRIYSVEDESGRDVIELFGPILHPWTFVVRIEGREVGKITKKWSGLLKEGFTDADNFGVTFDRDLPPSCKALLLAAVFLIDFVHFEGKN